MSFSKTTSSAELVKECIKSDSHEALLKPREDNNNSSIGFDSSKKSELSSDEEISEEEENESTPDTVLRRPLPTFPPRHPRRVSRTAEARVKHALTHAPRPGGFRVKHGIQVSLIRKGSGQGRDGELLRMVFLLSSVYGFAKLRVTERN